MNTSFTPGPWETSVLSEGFEWWIVGPGGGDKIAEVTESPKADANARLIAASPLLYRALSLLHGEFMSRMSLVRDADWAAEEIIAEDLARTAIQQATGQEP